MRDEDSPAKWFGGALPRQNAGEALPERSPAVLTPKLAGFQLQDAMPQPPTLVPRLAQPLIFEPEPIALAMGTASRPYMPRRNPHLPRHFLNACNLVSR